MSKYALTLNTAIEEAVLALHGCDDLKAFFRVAQKGLTEHFGATDCRMLISRGAGLPGLVLAAKEDGLTESRIDPRWLLGRMAQKLMASEAVCQLDSLHDPAETSRLPQAIFTQTKYSSAYGMAYFKSRYDLHTLIVVGDSALKEAAKMPEFCGFARHFRAALGRLVRSESERAINQGVRGFAARSCTGLVTLSWELQPTYSNRSAIKYCAAWLGGTEPTPTPKTQISLPPEIYQECVRLKNHVISQPTSDPKSEPGSVLKCGNQPGLRASVRLIRPLAGGLSRPYFQIRLEWPMAGVRTQPINCEPRSDDFRSLLSPSERVLLEVAAQGLCNEEIANRLGKSVATVKSQIQSIYRKLSISSRSELVARISGLAGAPPAEQLIL